MALLGKATRTLKTMGAAMVGSGELTAGLGVSEGGEWGLPGACVPLGLLVAVVVVGLLGEFELALLGAAVRCRVVGAMVVEVVGPAVVAVGEGI